MDILRGRRLEPLASEAVGFTSSAVDDKILVDAVVKINMAHVVMLVEKGIVPKSQGAKCLQGLLSLPKGLKLDPALEDVHMNVEAAVTKKVGEDAGGQLNLGKSRNDQVAAAIRIVLRRRVLEALSALIDARSVLLDLGRKALNIVMPGYTHLQHAQPVTLAHHLLAYHDALERDTQRLFTAFERVNVSPMGAAALATSTVGVDRVLVSSLLGFKGLVENSLDAVSSRDFAVEVVSDFALVMTDVSRVAEELILWSTDEFRAIRMPDAYSSTSSIMPQKKNPVVAELIRAKTSTVYGCLFTALSLLKGLPYSYNIDLQELTPSIWRASDATLSSLRILPVMLRQVKFDEKRLKELVAGDGSLATDVAECLATRYGVPFRTAHRVVGGLARKAMEEKTSFERVVVRDLNKALVQALGRKVSIPRKELEGILNIEESIKRRSADGGPSPTVVSKMIVARRDLLNQHRHRLREEVERLREADLLLLHKATVLKGGEKE